jgi:ribosome maturation factor RimP
VLFSKHRLSRRTPAFLEAGAMPAFLLSIHGEMTEIQTEIERTLAQAEPSVEVLLAEVVGGGTVRLFIDHPDGVSLELCERVTQRLVTVREQYALEVSSPGSDRPLSKPDHFRRYLGRHVRVRLAEPRDNRRTFTGELVGASDGDVTVATERGVVTFPYTDIVRANLIPGE